MERPDWSALESMLVDLEQAVTGLPQTQQRIREITGEATSPDQMIRAVVGPRGHLLELEIDPRVYRTPDSRALAASIVATVREAVEEASRQATDLLAGTLPGDLRPGAGDGLAGLFGGHDADLKERAGGADDGR